VTVLELAGVAAPHALKAAAATHTKAMAIADLSLFFIYSPYAYLMHTETLKRNQKIGKS
jgi:hypothetical protein